MGRTPWSARDPPVPLRQVCNCVPKGRPGGRLRTRGSALQFQKVKLFLRVSLEDAAPPFEIRS